VKFGQLAYSPVTDKTNFTEIVPFTFRLKTGGFPPATPSFNMIFRGRAAGVAEQILFLKTAGLKAPSAKPVKIKAE